MYQGESLVLRIKGVGDYDLDNMDFAVFVYPDGCICNDYKKEKSECERAEDGSYLCGFVPKITAAFPPVSHTLEIHDKTHNVVFVKKHAFNVELCATGREYNQYEEVGNE